MQLPMMLLDHLMQRLYLLSVTGQFDVETEQSSRLLQLLLLVHAVLSCAVRHAATARSMRYPPCCGKASTGIVIASPSDGCSNACCTSATVGFVAALEAGASQTGTGFPELARLFYRRQSMHLPPQRQLLQFMVLPHEAKRRERHQEQAALFYSSSGVTLRW
ncbi:hypothetical protein cyc_00348 [Cyclospora cayetanensis]|uniref:Uncharacterized protein n=1 Tax=Cyclospora cayetanensis TaxID=88456 RepID=A0A1D3D439_9EIME|nr:hypothetical protein cyc_00348 [Cyclospora cayetanensis]